MSFQNFWKVKLDWHTEFIEVLRKDFENRKNGKATVTLRGYAQRLGISPGTLSDLFKQKKFLSMERAQEVLKKIQVPPKELNQLLLKMGSSPQHDIVQLKEKDYDLLTDWEVGAVLFSSDLAKPYRHPEKIADMTGIPLKKVHEIISNLKKRNFLSVDKDGFIQRPDQYLMSSDNIPSEAVKLGHLANLKLSMRSLQEHPTEKRDITAITFAGTKEQISVLRKEIRELHAKAPTLMNQEAEPDSIFRLSIQLFPLDFKP